MKVVSSLAALVGRRFMMTMTPSTVKVAAITGFTGAD